VEGRREPKDKEEAEKAKRVREEEEAIRKKKTENLKEKVMVRNDKSGTQDSWKAKKKKQRLEKESKLREAKRVWEEKKKTIWTETAAASQAEARKVVETNKKNAAAKIRADAQVRVDTAMEVEASSSRSAKASKSVGSGEASCSSSAKASKSVGSGVATKPVQENDARHTIAARIESSASFKVRSALGRPAKTGRVGKATQTLTTYTKKCTQTERPKLRAWATQTARKKDGIRNFGTQTMKSTKDHSTVALVDYSSLVRLVDDHGDDVSRKALEQLFAEISNAPASKFKKVD
jgi:hypothetical protein